MLAVPPKQYSLKMNNRELSQNHSGRWDFDLAKQVDCLQQISDRIRFMRYEA